MRRIVYTPPPPGSRPWLAPNPRHPGNRTGRDVDAVPERTRFRLRGRIFGHRLQDDPGVVQR